MSILHIKSWIWVAFAGFLLIGVSCRKDKEITTQTIVYSTDPIIEVNCSITGVVTDGNGNPINNVSVFLNAFQVQTDDNGFFYLKDVNANQNGASVRFEKTGYHSTSKLVYPTLNRVEFIEVVLLQSDETGIVSKSKGGTVSLSNGVEVFFPENAFLNQGQGGDEVSVHMTYIDPTEDEMYQKMPGSLIGINQERRVLGMETFGMIGVELFDEDGNTVEMNPEKRATISMPIPDELRGVASESVPLWHFDLKSAYWVQEGSVNIDGDKYIGLVSHFSFWNIDVEMELIDFAAHLVNQQGMGLAQLEMRIKTTSPTNQTGYGISNDKGWVKGKIPANIDLVMEIYSKCNELIHSENIGPFNDDMTDEEYVINEGDQSTIQGFLVSCFDVPVKNGYVKAINQGGDFYLTTDSTGAFVGNLSLCNKREVILVGYDLQTGFQSQRETFAVEPLIDAETIEACDQIAYVFEISFPQGNYVIENCTGQLITDTSGNMEPNVYVRAEDNTGEVTMEIDTDAEGVFPVKNFRLSLPNNPDEVFFNHSLTCTLESWEAAPSIALGSIDGKVLTSQGDTVSITGSFTALRD